MAAKERPIPSPPTSPETQRFWDAAAQGTLLVKRCTVCGEAHPKVQVKSCDVALAHGTGGSLGTRHGSATLIMGRE